MVCSGTLHSFKNMSHVNKGFFSVFESTGQSNILSDTHRTVCLFIDALVFVHVSNLSPRQPFKSPITKILLIKYTI